MKIVVDTSACDLHGQCVFVAPELFRFDDAGELVWEPEAGAELEAKAEAARSVCPAGAIELVP